MGLETSATSESVTIDMTHPVVNRDKLLVSESFLSAENSIQIVYINGAFVDPESGRLKSSKYDFFYRNPEFIVMTFDKIMHIFNKILFFFHCVTIICGKQY